MLCCVGAQVKLLANYQLEINHHSEFERRQFERKLLVEANKKPTQDQPEMPPCVLVAQLKLPEGFGGHSPKNWEGFCWFLN